MIKKMSVLILCLTTLSLVASHWSPTGAGVGSGTPIGNARICNYCNTVVSNGFGHVCTLCQKCKRYHETHLRCHALKK